MSTATLVSEFPAPFVVDYREIEKGLPVLELEAFCQSSGLPFREVQAVVIPARTLKHRRQKNQPLSLEESDRLARVVRTFALAARVVGDLAGGREWLLYPIELFDGRSALEMLRTETGGRQVEELLLQIDEGVFA